MRVTYVAGPPGTGKTTWLEKRVAEDVAVFGEKSVLVNSLTKAAVEDFRSRESGIHPTHVVTLHSACSRAIGNKRLRSTQDTDVWNQAHAKDWHITGLAKSSSTSKKPGDKILEEIEFLKMTEADRDAWSNNSKHFNLEWHKFKQLRCFFDFYDLIGSLAYDNYFDQKWIQGMGLLPAIMGNPVAGVKKIYVDETQDYSLVELKVLEKWAKYVGNITYIGDVDQSIYSFRGAHPSRFGSIADIADEVIILDQSHRVPRKVHSFAKSIIRMNTGRREHPYLPVPKNGRLRRSSATVNDIEILIEDIRTNVKNKQTTAFLASCDFMLIDIARGLSKNNIIHSSLSANDRLRYNPMSFASKTFPLHRIKSFLYPKLNEGKFWPIGELSDFVPKLTCRLLQTGAKELVKSQCENDVSNEPEEEIFSPKFLDDFDWLFKLERIDDIYAAACDGDLDFFFDNLMNSEVPKYEFYRRQYKESGLDFLEKKSFVKIGTIHGSKGSEYDHVYLFPDLSKSFDFSTGPNKEELNRLYYVGATRSKTTLTLCSSASKRKFDFWENYYLESST